MPTSTLSASAYTMLTRHKVSPQVLMRWYMW